MCSALKIQLKLVNIHYKRTTITLKIMFTLTIKCDRVPITGRAGNTEGRRKEDWRPGSETASNARLRQKISGLSFIIVSRYLIGNAMLACDLIRCMRYNNDASGSVIIH